MPRTVPEWIAKHDDQQIPPRVRMRVFDRFNGVCQLSGRKIMPGDTWEIDHIKGLHEGGQHRESNFQPALYKPHKEKTRDQMAVKKKVNRMRAKHLGIHEPKSRLSHPRLKKRMDGKVVDRETGEII
jgi:5-methylcytosine-specific restriction endonuclease McrA